MTRLRVRSILAVPRQGLRSAPGEPTDRLRPVRRHGDSRKAVSRFEEAAVSESQPGRPKGRTGTLEEPRFRQDRCGRRPRGLAGKPVAHWVNTGPPPGGEAERLHQRGDRSHRKVASPPERGLGSGTDYRLRASAQRHGQAGRPPRGATGRSFGSRWGWAGRTRTAGLRLDRAGRGDRKDASTDRPNRLERVEEECRGTPRGRRFGEAPSGFSHFLRPLR